MNKEIDVGTIDEAKRKMKESYNEFVYLISKFLSVADFYSEVNNYYQKIDDRLISDYSRYSSLLKDANSNDFCYELSKECLFYLDFIDEIKENLDNYHLILENKQDESLTEYEKACDILTICDEFEDLSKPINEAYDYIYKQKKVIPHKDDPRYDSLSKTLMERKNNG